MAESGMKTDLAKGHKMLMGWDDCPTAAGGGRIGVCGWDFGWCATGTPSSSLHGLRLLPFALHCRWAIHRLGTVGPMRRSHPALEFPKTGGVDDGQGI